MPTRGSEAQPLLPSSAPPPPPPRRRPFPSSIASSSVSPRHRIRRPTTLRHDIWTVLRFRSSVTHRSGLQLASYFLEICILALVTLNVVLAITESEALVSTTSRPSEWYELVLFMSTIVFSIEYALRFWSCVEDERYNSAILGRLKWMMRPMSLIDLLALVPFYLEISFEFMVIPAYPGALTLRSLRLLRILSFLRLERSYSAMTNLRLIFGKKKEELLVVSYLTAVLVLTSSTTIFFLENAAQPAVFRSIATSAWWSVETITSLGYGDMVPQTTAGRLFGAVLALWGIILFTIPGAILGSAFIEVMLEQHRREEEDAVSLVLSKGEWDLSNGFHLDTSRHNSDADKYYTGVHSPPSPSGLHTPTHPRPSPRVAAVLRLEAVAQRVEDVAATQHHIQEQLAEQRAELRELKRLVEILVARTEPVSS